ncbi:hypothetical protein ACU686_29975 [Yinghuangia aomiensis]
MASPFDGNDLYPDEYGRAAEPGNPLARQYYEQSARYLDSLRSVIEDDSRIIAGMRTFERRHPDFTTAGGTVYLHREPGSATTNLMFRDRAGHTRVLKADFSPSLEYPDVYPRGFWASPDGKHVIYSDADSVDESGATLHMVRTDTGETAALPVDATFPSGSWIDNHRFLYAKLAPGEQQPWRQHWTLMLRTIGPDGEVTDRPAPEFERASDNSRYDVVPGPFPGTATLLSYGNILNTPQSVRVIDLDGRGRGFTIQRENRVLARVRPGPVREDGSRPLFVLRNDLRSFRAGRVVLVDPGKSRWFGRPSRRQVVAGRRGDIIREIEVIDRGPGQLPSLALSIRRHGAESRVDIVDLKKSRWRGKPTAARRWTVPFPDAQPITAAGKRDRIHGWYGTVAAMTPTPGADGRGGLHIEYAARECVPHRLYQLDTIEPDAAPRRIAGPSRAEGRAKGVPRRHGHPAPGPQRGPPQNAAVRRPSDAGPGRRAAPVHVQRLSVLQPRRAEPELRRGHGQGCEQRHRVGPRGGVRRRRAELPRGDGSARGRPAPRPARHGGGHPTPGRPPRTGPHTPLRLLPVGRGHDPARRRPLPAAPFRGLHRQRPADRLPTRRPGQPQRVHARRQRDATGGRGTPSPEASGNRHRSTTGSRSGSSPAWSISGSRPKGVLRTAAALEAARMRRLGPLADKLKDGPRSSLCVVANAGGHFPGVGPQAVISAVVGEVAGCHPLRLPVNTTRPRIPPGVAVLPDAPAPLQAAELRRPAVALAAPRSGLATSGLAAVSRLVRSAVPGRRAGTQKPPTDRQAARGPDRRIKEVERLLRR